jgi:hypothetical protein
MAGPRIRLKVIAGRPVRLEDTEGPQPPQSPQQSKVAVARSKFGRPFAHEPGSDFERGGEPVLTRWLRKVDWRNVKR